MRKLLLLAVATLALAPALAHAQTYGPDAFGYTLTRTGFGSAAASGYVSIVGQGGTTQLTTSGTTSDDVTFTVTPSFSVPYYGTNNAQVFVSTNGFIALGGNTGSSTGGSYNNPNLALATITGGGTGAPTVERAVIAPLWDDLFFSGTQPGALYTAERISGSVTELVFEYSGVQFFDAQTTPMTFQAVLRSDGTQSWYYPDVTTTAGGTNGNLASIGLHDLNGGAGVNRFISYGFNTTNALANFDRIDIGFAAVPEPTTIALVSVAAIGGLGYMARRYRTSNRFGKIKK